MKHMFNRTCGAVVFASLALLVAGCGPKGTDQLPGKEREKTITRVISLSPSSTEIYSLNSVSMGLIGRSEADDWPVSVKQIPSVTKGTKPDYELIIKMKPQAILYDGDLFSESDLEPLKASGAELVKVSPKTVEEYEAIVVTISQWAGRETTASEFLDKMHNNIASAKTKMPKDGVSVAILMGGGANEYFAAGTGSFQGNLMKEMNLKYMGPDGEKFMPVNVEQLIAWNPDMILAPGKDSEAILSDPRLAGLSAVKKRRVFEINPSVLLRVGSRVADLALGVGVQAQRIQEESERSN